MLTALDQSLGMHRECCAQPSVMVLESLGLYSLPRKQHSLALIRARAQGLSVEVDSHDFSGHGEVRCQACSGKISGPLYGHRAPVSRMQSKPAQRVRWVEVGGFPWS